MENNTYDLSSTMLDSFIIEGLWYIDGLSQEEWIAGTLEYEPTKITLKLMGSFNDLFSSYKLEDDTIFGFSNKGKRVSLKGCYIINDIISFPGLTTTIYHAQKMLVSDNEIPDYESLEVSKVYFSFQGYKKWNQLSGLRIVQNPKTGEKNITSSKALLEDIQQTTILTKFNIEFSELAEIDFYMNHTSRDISVDQKKYLSISYLDSTTVGVEEALDISQRISDMYSLFMNNRLNYNHITLQLKNQSEGQHQKVKMFFVQRLSVDNNRHLLNYNDIRNDLPIFINKFFEQYSRLRKVIGGHLNSSFKSYFEIEDFLEATRNLETFSRNYMSVEPSFPDNYSEKKEELLNFLKESSSEELKIFFERKINFVGEVSLRKKIKNLIRLVPEELRVVIFKIPDKSPSKSIDKFCQTVSESRNYFTHGDDISKYPNAVYNPQDLHEFYMKLRCLMDILFLQKLQVSERVIIDSISSWNGPYQQFFHK